MKNTSLQKRNTKKWSFPLNEQRKREIEKLAMKLPTNERVIVFLKYWRDLPFSQIAKALGMEFYDVCIIHENAVAILKQYLKKAMF